MDIISVVKRKNGDIPIWVWIIFSLVPIFFFSIYTYNDVIETTEDGLAVWYVLFSKKSIGEYYVTPYPFRTGSGYPSYDFFIYIIFALWDFPLFIYEKISKISFEQSYVLVLYAKSISLFFLILSTKQIYKITLHITNDDKKSNWSCFTYIFSVIVFQSIGIICGYDVISIVFTLCGIYAYLQEKDKKFFLYFSCAIACKMFALFVFIPLLLIKYKKVWKVLVGFFCGVGLIVIPKLYFLMYRSTSGIQALRNDLDSLIVSADAAGYIDGYSGISGMQSVQNDLDSTIVSANAIRYIDSYLWSSESPIATISMPWFFFLTFILWLFCWFHFKKPSDRMIIYICLLGMSIFMLTCYTHPQWMILIMPYIAILECDNWANLSMKLFCEVCMGMSHILWMVRYAPQCFSYNIINNMLHFEEGDREFWYTGIWMFINKLEDIIHIQVDHIFIAIRSVLVASFMMLLLYLCPRDQQQETTIESKQINRLFYVKAAVSMLVLFIPMLGVILRIMEM